VFAATVIVSVAERVPLALAGSAIQGTGLAAAHAQPVSVSIAALTSPPFAATVMSAGVTL
jgi:hypothetical protein